MMQSTLSPVEGSCLKRLCRKPDSSLRAATSNARDRYHMALEEAADCSGSYVIHAVHATSYTCEGVGLSEDSSLTARVFHALAN